MKKKSFVVLLIITFLASTLLIGCGSDRATTIDAGGSSTLAPIVTECAENFKEEFVTWNNVDPSFPEEPISVLVHTGGSGFGISSTLDSTFDIGMVARDLREEEEEGLADGNVVQIGADVLTIAVNPNNPIVDVKPDLTKEEIRSIFAGEIKTWNELDSNLPDTNIILGVRDLGGGASQIFDDAIMHGTPISDEALQIGSMPALASKVKENENTIAYVSSGLVNQNPDEITALSVDGVAPTIENINDGLYTIGRPLLLVTKSEPSAKQQAFIDYLQTESAHEVITDLGYIPSN
ncbi:Phosphate ABC transporter, substrate-binding protein PstS [Candidatus Syntrophocurvum alkaliphilum]|uniref:Phosphate ABC transporter, substrate-binding protein PstS n=1 Tax=Candidatus Syntrophocurvum alkaliphilum TaxID=2293317 RepID=A0A6I6DN05_9FIRM|nr:phosphate ABC transporter substrate-binding protein [Candidatus Syntrophocurvum alkaliphilum]QGU00388.1 Phosphate ABC transporter, substrate-binding protein PstS [Candidatus Syntrophocurvum alkaliphilum]